MATIHKMHVHPSLSNAKPYLELLKVHKSMNVSVELLKAYKELSKAVGTGIEQAILARGQTYVPIPPIALEIFKKVSRLDEILEEALLMRQKFHKIRKTYADYTEIITDEDTPIEKSLAAQAKLKEVLTELSSRYGTTEERCILEWSDTGELAKTLLEVDEEDPTTLFKFFLGKPIELIQKWYSRRKFLQLYQLRREALRTIGYDRQIQKLWGKAADIAGMPPPVLDENVDYPIGSGWNIYDFDMLPLWSWSGKYIGYKKRNQFFTNHGHHFGQFVGNEVYSPDGNYLGELKFGRLVTVAEHKIKKVSSVPKANNKGASISGFGDLASREFVEGCKDFPNV